MRAIPFFWGGGRLVPQPEALTAGDAAWHLARESLRVGLCVTAAASRVFDFCSSQKVFLVGLNSRAKHSMKFAILIWLFTSIMAIIMCED